MICGDNMYNNTKFYLSMAGQTIEVHSLYDRCLSMYVDYMIPNAAIKSTDFSVDIVPRNIKKENDISQRNIGENEIYRYLDPGYLEFFAIQRKICEEMPTYNTMLMHGAVVAHKGKAYMFTAPSGTGKTTHIRKWLDNLEDAYVVNGDKPLIKIINNEVIAYGSPWCGKEKMGRNCMVPLKAIIFLERAENNSIEEISFYDAFDKLFSQTYKPERTDQLKKTINLLAQMNNKIHFYRFRCNNMKEDCFATVYDALVKNNA